MEALERENNAKEALGMHPTVEEAAEDEGDEKKDGIDRPPHDNAGSGFANTLTGGLVDRRREALTVDGRLAAMKRSVETKVGCAKSC